MTVHRASQRDEVILAFWKRDFEKLCALADIAQNAPPHGHADGSIDAQEWMSLVRMLGKEQALEAAIEDFRITWGQTDEDFRERRSVLDPDPEEYIEKNFQVGEAVSISGVEIASGEKITLRIPRNMLRFLQVFHSRDTTPDTPLDPSS